jgi:tyrosyl-tRNA synthetase
MDTKKIMNALKAGVHEITPEKDLAEKIDSGRQLTIKLGMDPTAPDLHLGHAVVLSKLKQFQDLGHRIVFLIGDYTARIGDPTGRSKTRPPLTKEQIDQHTQTYFEQVSRILDRDKINVVYNSQWLEKLSSSDFINLCSRVTVARIIEREDFAQRLQAKQSVGFHELLYPLLQGYDSVELHADVELGGTDQTFNLLMGRHLQESFGQKPQTVITTPILPGLDGVAKMSKSLGNTIGLIDKPEDAYGKLMSISDDLMWEYFELLLHKTDEDITSYKDDIASSKVHPMDIKKEMAYHIIERFWSEKDAHHAQDHFEHLFQKKDYSHATPVNADELKGQDVTLLALLKHLKCVESSSQARRLIASGAVSIDDSKIVDKDAPIRVRSSMIIRVGKHKFYQIV